MNSNSHHRIGALDALKGIGAIGVIMGHFGSEGINISLVEVMIGNAVRTVQLFFIISTFLCVKSIESHNPVTIRDYVFWMFNNIIRLIPLYYFSIILYGFFPSLAGWGEVQRNIDNM